MSFTPPPQPPGWYHAQGDPPGTNRWWDGAQWVGGPVAAAGGAPQGGPPAGWAPPPGAHYWAPTEPYAGWWMRFAAMIVDRVVLGIPIWIVMAGTIGAVPKKIEACTLSDGRRGLCEVPTGSGWLTIGIVGLLCFVGVVLYFGLQHGRTGQTLGKRALGIRVVDRNTRQPIGVGRGIGRFFGTIVSSFVCSLGFLWAAWDSEKQTWHDKMVNSIVVPAR